MKKITEIFSSSLLLLIMVMLITNSCERNIDLKLPQAEDKIVIEGYIENGKAPYVVITRNSPYFGEVDSASLIKLLVTNAQVTVSDGNVTVPLDFKLNMNVFPPVYYAPNTNALVGEIGKTYYLTVTVDGKTYTATTTIPPLAPLDSIWFKIEPNFDSMGYIWAHGTDPDTLGNCYRVFAMRLHKDNYFLPTFPSTMDDRLINGKSFDFNLSRGSVFNSPAEDDHNVEAGFFKKKDTIIVRFCTLDRAHYDFWSTAETEMYGGGNPFSSPATVKTNIKGGGLGVWGGYGAVYDTIIAK